MQRVPRGGTERISTAHFNYTCLPRNQSQFLMYLYADNIDMTVVSFRVLKCFNIYWIRSFERQTLLEYER